MAANFKFGSRNLFCAQIFFIKDFDPSNFEAYLTGPVL